MTHEMSPPPSTPQKVGPTREVTAADRRRRSWMTLLFAIVILTPSMLGFLAKFSEFLHTFRGEAGGTFAITPMVNYLLASLGFLCMMIWATLNGMFHDMERPKEVMLERERALDRSTRSRSPMEL